jgi:hypothetical protein
MKEYKFLTHVEWLKNKFGFYVELYEQAFTELKLKNAREMEQQMMTMSDHESRMMMYQKDEGEVARMVFEEIPIFANKGEAQLYIARMKTTVNSLFVDNKNFKMQNNELVTKVQNLEQIKTENLETISKWQSIS